MADVLEPVAEVADVVAEQATEVAEVARRLSSRDLGLVSVGIGAGLVGGAFFGYYVTKTRLKTKYEALADAEISEMAEHFRNARIIEQEEKPPLGLIVEGLGYVAPDEPTITEPVKSRYTPKEEGAIAAAIALEEEIAALPDATVNVFGDQEDVWDYALEIEGRTEDLPHVIHVDEFKENANEDEQTTLTYFAGDDVLCDVRDQPVDDQDALVGVENLGKFGHGSLDPNVVYVRNPELSMSIEILRSEGKFAHEVHGFEDELRHSAPSRHIQRRARFDDE